MKLLYHRLCSWKTPLPALTCGHVHAQWYIPFVVLLGGVCSLVDQQVHYVQAVGDGSQVQRPHAMAISSIQVHTVLDEVLMHDGRVNSRQKGVRV